MDDLTRRRPPILADGVLSPLAPTVRLTGRLQRVIVPCCDMLLVIDKAARDRASTRNLIE